MTSNGWENCQCHSFNITKHLTWAHSNREKDGALHEIQNSEFNLELCERIWPGLFSLVRFPNGCASAARVEPNAASEGKEEHTRDTTCQIISLLMTSYIILCKTFQSAVRAWCSFNNLLEHFIPYSFLRFHSFHFFFQFFLLLLLRNACKMSLHLQREKKINMDIVSNGRYVFCGSGATAED